MKSIILPLLAAVALFLFSCQKEKILDSKQDSVSISSNVLAKNQQNNSLEIKTAESVKLVSLKDILFAKLATIEN